MRSDLANDILQLTGEHLVLVGTAMLVAALGIVVPFLLPDRPRDAGWLEPHERDWLEQTLAAERADVAGNNEMTLGSALRQRTVWVLALGIMAVNTGGYALVFWLPTAMKASLAG